MRYTFEFILLLAFLSPVLRAQDTLFVPEPVVVPLDDLVTEALARNPAILGAIERISAANALAGQTGTLDSPELTYRRKEMPGFRWRDAMSSEWELMQMLRFPTKYATERTIGDIQAEHAHHETEEIVNSVLLELRENYAELWFVQQRTIIERENLRLTERLREIAASRYRVGLGARNEMLMADMLRTGTMNSLLQLRQTELGLKARLSALLDRRPADTLGYAVVDENPAFGLTVDSLLALTRSTRPMLIHDSLGILERQEMLSSAKQAYLPDFRLGVSYMDSEMEMFTGWSVSAGITLPFAPWTLGRTGSGVEEAEHRLLQAEKGYASTVNMVEADVRAAWLDVTGALQRMDNVGKRMLPSAEQALASSLTEYEAGTADYAVVHQAYQALTGAQTEYFSIRLEYERSLARLRFATGYNGTFQ